MMAKSVHFGRQIADLLDGGTYRVAQKLAHFVRLITSSNIDQFSIFLTFKIRRKFVIELLLKIPPHLKCVATLPYEMSVS